MIAPAKPIFSRLDKAFREDSTRSFHLTIRLSPGGFSFVIFAADKQKYIGLEVFKFNTPADDVKYASLLDEIIMHRQWIAYPYQSVIVIVDHISNALIPSPLFDEKEKGTYLAFNQPYRDNSRIAVDNLKNADAKNVYYLSNPLVAKIKELWANADIVHLSSVLIESLLLTNKNKGFEDKVFVNVRDQIFDLVVLRDEKLYFYNQYKFNTKEDFLYFLLFSMEQLRLNPEITEFIYSGLIDKDSPLYELAWHHIRNSRFIARNENFKYSYVLDDIQSSQYFILFNAQQCEL
jgi:hypothetical protein